MIGTYTAPATGSPPAARHRRGAAAPRATAPAAAPAPGRHDRDLRRADTDRADADPHPAVPFESVTPGGPAAECGRTRAGDRLVAVAADGRAVGAVPLTRPS